LAVVGGRDFSEGVVGTLLVVVDHPFVDDLADLGEAAKQMRIEHLV
jgi:hypothetical protein